MGHRRDDVRRGPAPGASTAVVMIPTAGVMLEAELVLPERPAGVVMIAPGVGGARRRPHLRTTVARLAGAGWATLLVELLTPREERLDESAVQWRLDIGLLAGRLAGVLDWVRDQHDLGGLPVGLLGAGRGAAATLLTAARRPASVDAVVSRDLRIGLGEDTLSRVIAPTLLITADHGSTAEGVARRTARRLGGRTELRVVAEADGPFLEPDPLQQVLALTCDWLLHHLTPPPGG